jgi:hypothetical protein
MDLGGSPIRVFFGHATDQGTNLFGDLGPAAVWTGSPAPVEPETGAVPADDGLGFYDEQAIPPAWPETAERSPEESIQRVQYRPWPFTFENGDLLSQCEDFQGRFAPTAEEGSDGGND